MLSNLSTSASLSFNMSTASATRSSFSFRDCPSKHRSMRVTESHRTASILCSRAAESHSENTASITWPGMILFGSSIATVP